MTTAGPGLFNVVSNEQITVTIEKTAGSYSVQLTPVFGGASWNPIPDPGAGLIAVGGFDIPADPTSTTSFGGIFNFIPGVTDDTQVDMYLITLRGSAGGTPVPIAAFPPGAPTKTFTFLARP